MPPAAEAVPPAAPGASSGRASEHDEESSDAVSSMQGSDPTGANMGNWLPGVLQMLAKTQRELVGKIGKTPDTDKKKNYLANVKIEEFFGDKGTSAYSYR